MCEIGNDVVLVNVNVFLVQDQVKLPPVTQVSVEL